MQTRVGRDAQDRYHVLGRYLQLNRIIGAIVEDFKKSKAYDRRWIQWPSISRASAFCIRSAKSKNVYEKRYMDFTNYLRTFGLIKDPVQLQGAGWSGRKRQIQTIIYSKRGHSCALELLQVGSKRLENLQNNTPSERPLFKWNRNIYPCSGLIIQFYISEIHLVRFANAVTSFSVIRLLGE